VTDYTPVGEKQKKIWRYGMRLAKRGTTPRFHCYDSGCTVVATSHADLSRHQSAKLHGPFHPKTPRKNVTVEGIAPAA
jgi:hypothetical protein